MKRVDRFEAVGLDFDGTIADTRAAMTQSRLESFLSMGQELHDERYTQIDPGIHAEAHHHGTHVLEIFGWVMLQAGIVADLEAERGTVQKLVDRRNEIYWGKARYGFDAIPGALETVSMLHERLDGRVSIVTTAPLEEEVMPYMERYGLMDLFEPEDLITAS